jgi:hypothetical protein
LDQVFQSFRCSIHLAPRRCQLRSVGCRPRDACGTMSLRNSFPLGPDSSRTTTGSRPWRRFARTASRSTRAPSSETAGYWPRIKLFLAAQAILDTPYGRAGWCDCQEHAAAIGQLLTACARLHESNHAPRV